MNIGTWQVRGRRKFCCRWILNRTLWITAEPFLVKWQKWALFFCAIYLCLQFDILGTKERKKCWIPECLTLAARDNPGQRCVGHFGRWGHGWGHGAALQNHKGTIQSCSVPPAPCSVPNKPVTKPSSHFSHHTHQGGCCDFCWGSLRMLC